MPPCIALLDDMGPGAQPRSRLYTELVEVLAIHQAGELGALCDRIDAALAGGLHPVGLFAYELGAKVQSVPEHALEGPLAQVLLFRRCRRLTGAQVDAWVAEQVATAGYAGIADVRSSVSRTAFQESIDAIKNYIAAGDAYQVNYTYRIDFDAHGSPLALYARLRQRQRVPYGALITLPDGAAVVSLSPELFLRHAGGHIRAMPMKGTAPADAGAASTQQVARDLATDPKNRAENLMIVDLLRNDIGRIARTGSVRVPSLFDVTRFGDVLQMTSTVEAELKPETRLVDLFASMFPCGSITGAPKRRSMQIIHELEPRARGLYTGAIACFDPPARPGALPGICMSVPIRTLSLAPPQQGVRAGVLGVGAGIVADSDAGSEFEECRLKAGFLTGLRNDFSLVETVFATRGQGCRHLARHMARLAQSAGYFGFPVEVAEIERDLQAQAQQLPNAAPWRMRVSVQPSGHWTIDPSALEPIGDAVDVLWEPDSVDSQDLLLRHKTSLRTQLDQAWRRAQAVGAFDSLLFNERDELTQGGRSNVFVQLDGRWCTPPVHSGVLPGVMRSVLLATPAWRACERVILREELGRATALVVCNALRGPLKARLVQQPGSAERMPRRRTVTRAMGSAATSGAAHATE